MLRGLVMKVGAVHHIHRKEAWNQVVQSISVSEACQEKLVASLPPNDRTERAHQLYGKDLAGVKQGPGVLFKAVSNPLGS